MRWLRRLRRRPLWLVYHDAYEQVVPAIPIDPQRATRVLAFLRSEALVRPRDVAGPLPASLEAMLRVHTEGHVESLDRTDTATRIYGVPIDDRQRQRALDAQRMAAGGTIQAVRLARGTGRIALNLGGGLHHATADQGMAFCLLNDIAIAIAHLRRYRFRARILVIDLDLHDGNGTRAIFADDPTVHTYSVHNNDWEPLGGIATTSVALGTGVNDEEYLATVRETLPPVLAEFQPGLVIYVAGTDPAADDRLGDWHITAAGMLARDRFVVEQVRGHRRSVPLAVVLSGGYGGQAWRYTARFASWLAMGHAIEPPADLTLEIRRMRASQSAIEPTRDDDWGLVDSDLYGVVPGATAPRRVLGAFSKHAVELSLERAGILDAVRRRGFTHPVLDVDFASALGETIRVYGDGEQTELLIELRVTRSKRQIPGIELLYAEWLLLQNPREEFSDANPRLPGQEHPGLGLLREIIAWLVVLCESLGLDGIGFVPAQFYMAVLGRHHVRFFDPDAQARFEALYRTLGRLPLHEAMQALESDRVRDEATGKPVTWEGNLQVYPVSERMKALVGREGGRSTNRYRFEVNAPES